MKGGFEERETRGGNHVRRRWGDGWFLGFYFIFIFFFYMGQIRKWPKKESGLRVVFGILTNFFIFSPFFIIL